MKLVKSFFGRVIKDFRQKELLPLKLVFFTQLSTLFIIYPYLTVHMRELGINVEETAIMSAIFPFFSIMMPPIAGLIADRIGNFKVVMSFLSILGGASALLLLLVPVGRFNVQLPKDVVFGIGCSSNASDSLVLTMNQDHPCDTELETRLDLVVQSCGFACLTVEPKGSDIEKVLRSRNYKLQVYDQNTETNEVYNYSISQNEMPVDLRVQNDLRISRELKNLEFYKIAIRRLSKNVVFFPVHKPQLFHLSCNINATSAGDDRAICGFNAALTSDREKKLELTRFKASVKALKLEDRDNFEHQRRYLVQSIDWSNHNGQNTAVCEDNQDNERVSVELKLTTSEYGKHKIVRAKECARRCVITAPRTKICRNEKTIVDNDPQLTFWSYLCIRVFISLVSHSGFAMFEGAVIAILRERKADYGLQRIYGNIGGVISAPLSGLLIDYTSRGKGYTNFRPAFYLYAVLKMLAGFLILLVNLEFKVPATDVIGDAMFILKNIEVVTLLVTCFVLGNAWGYIESFLFWLLEDLGASKGLMGLTLSVGSLAGIPLLVLSGPLVDKLGHANIIFIGFVFYAIRLTGYSLITQPWQSLIFESLESVTSALSFTAAVTYAAKFSTSSTDTSVQGLLGGIYYGVGKGSGSLIGGYLIKAFGDRITYRIFAVVTLITGFIYLLFYHTYLKKRPQLENNDADIVKEKPIDGVVAVINGDNKESSKMSKAKEAADIKKTISDIEAVNNAKNLDAIESVAERRDDKNNDEKKEKKKKPMTRHHNDGCTNAAYVPEGDESKGGGCEIVIENGSRQST